MGTAKSLIKAMIKQDTKALARIVPETSPTDSVKEMVLISDSLEMNNMKMSDFKFSEDEQEGDILVSFDDTTGRPIVWKLHFTKKSYQDFYTFEQFYSGRVFKNNTLNDVVESFLQGYIANDPAFVSKLELTELYNTDAATGQYNIESFSSVAKVRIKNVNQVTIGKPKDTGVFNIVAVDLKIKSGKKEKKATIYIGDNDLGYFFSGVKGSTELFTHDSPKRAIDRFILDGIRSPDYDKINQILTDHECQKASDIIHFAQKHGTIGMSAEQFYVDSGDGKNDHVIEFQDNKGKKINWVLHFIQDEDLYFLDDTNLVSLKKKDYKPDINNVSQGSPIEAAQSIVQGLIDQNPEPLARLMWKGTCNPALQLMNAKAADLVAGMPMDKIQFEEGPGKNIVTVSFQKNGKTVQWKLHLQEGKNQNSGKFYLDATDILDQPTKYLDPVK